LASLFGGQGKGEQALALAAERLDPRFVFRSELLLEFPAKALRQGRTLAVGRNRDLKFSPIYDRRIIEVASGGIVDYVAQNAAPLSFMVNAVVQFA
jgi:hypothetical protein